MVLIIRQVANWGLGCLGAKPLNLLSDESDGTRISSSERVDSVEILQHCNALFLVHAEYLFSSVADKTLQAEPQSAAVSSCVTCDTGTHYT